MRPSITQLARDSVKVNCDIISIFIIVADSLSSLILYCIAHLMSLTWRVVDVVGAYSAYLLLLLLPSDHFSSSVPYSWPTEMGIILYYIIILSSGRMAFGRLVWNEYINTCEGQQQQRHNS